MTDLGPGAGHTSSGPEPSATARQPLGTGTYITILGFSFLVLRVFAVSGYDWDTAFLVSSTLSVSDGLTLLFGSLMAEHLLVTLLLVWILPLMISTYLWAPAGHRSRMALPATLGLVVMVALTVSFQHWWLPVASGAILGVFALIRRRAESSLLRRASSAVLAKVGWVGGLAVLLAAALVQTPWVPKEHIDTAHGPIVGYVLSVDSGYLNVLTEDHEFKILVSSDILSRR